jgi:hypothetical protein
MGSTSQHSYVTARTVEAAGNLRISVTAAASRGVLRLRAALRVKTCDLPAGIERWLSGANLISFSRRRRR